MALGAADQCRDGGGHGALGVLGRRGAALGAFDDLGDIDAEVLDQLPRRACVGSSAWAGCSAKEQGGQQQAGA
jgi:hypothetical protein